MIECRAPPSIPVPPIAGTDSRQNNRTAHGGTTATKVENEVDIKKEVNMEFCAPSTSPSMNGTDKEEHNYQPSNDEYIITEFEAEVDIKKENEIVDDIDDEEHNNQTIKNEYVITELEDEIDVKKENQMNIKVEDEIEIGEPSIYIQSIPRTYDEPYQTIQNEFTEIVEETEFCDEIKIDTCKSSIPDKPTELKGNKKKSEFICDICSKKYSLKSSLDTHRKRHGEPNFHCTVCGVAAFRQCDIYMHMLTHDTNRIHFTCDICPKKYSTKAHLAEHRLRHGKPNLHCTVCGVAKFLQYELDRHMKTHDTNPIIFTCDLCPKKYSLKSSLNAHRLRHRKPNFHCTVCGVAKFYQYELDRHMRTHATKEHDTNRIYFTCDLCPAKLSSKSELAKHRLRHGKPNFKCDVCGAAKFTQREVNYHMKSHDIKREKLKCPQCPQLFLQKQSVDYHIRTVHIDERPSDSQKMSKVS